MQVILLPRADRSNKQWLEDVGFSLHDIVQGVSLHHYDHWNSSHDIDVDSEVAILQKRLSGDAIVIGTELGALIALQALGSNKIKPAAYVLIDPPFDWARSRGSSLQSFVSLLPKRSLIIHTKPLSSHAKEIHKSLPGYIKDIVLNGKANSKNVDRTLRETIKGFLVSLKA